MLNSGTRSSGEGGTSLLWERFFFMVLVLVVLRRSLRLASCCWVSFFLPLNLDERSSSATLNSGCSGWLLSWCSFAEPPPTAPIDASSGGKGFKVMTLPCRSPCITKGGGE